MYVSYNIFNMFEIITQRPFVGNTSRVKFHEVTYTNHLHVCTVKVQSLTYLEPGLAIN